MLKRSILFMLVAIFAFSVGYAAAQSSSTSDQNAQQSPAMKTQQFSGVVEKINMEKKTITLKDSVTKENKDYTFSDATSFTKGTESATATSLKKGDRVMLEVDAQNKVSTVRITPKTQNPY